MTTICSELHNLNAHCLIHSAVMCSFGHVLFLKTLPVPAAGAACSLAAVATAAVFLAAAVLAPTPFLMVLMTVRFAGGALIGAAIAVAGRFLTTVDVLPSLDSLMALTLRAVRVAGRDA